MFTSDNREEIVDRIKTAKENLLEERTEDYQRERKYALKTQFCLSLN